MELLIKEVVPESIFELDGVSHFIPAETSFNRLNDALPIINISPADEAPCTLSISLLCSGQHTHGVGRFLSDKISRSLVPSKELALIVTRSLNFKFLIHPYSEYFIIERVIEIESERDLKIVQENFPQVAQEIRVTILGAQHARKIVLYKELSIGEKGVMLLENFASLIKCPHQGAQHTIFYDVHHFLLKAIRESGDCEIYAHLLPFLKTKTQKIDSNVFSEIQDCLTIFDGAFFVSRPLHHINKILAYFYLFRKIIAYTIMTKPHKRHVSFKLQRTKIKVCDSIVPVIALLVGVNFIEEDEVLEEEDIFKVVKKELPGVELVQDSLTTKDRSKKQVCILYLEIQNSDKSPFTPAAVKLLKKKVAEKICQCIHKDTVPTLSHYSEDEIVQNILTLSDELKNSNDPPQIIIQFRDQFQTELHFSVIVMRIQKPGLPTLTIPSTPHILVRKLERKVCGVLNECYLKEAYLIDVCVKDVETVAEGREKLFSSLKVHLNQLHDYNGGVPAKQYEILSHL